MLCVTSQGTWTLRKGQADLLPFSAVSAGENSTGEKTQAPPSPLQCLELHRVTERFLSLHVNV